METLQNEIQTILNNQLPGFYIEVNQRKNYFGNDQYLKINIATSNYQINNVSGQYYNNISLSLSEDLELKFQVFGGNGGQCFYRSIDPNNPKEKYYALQRVKIPFRTPNKNREAVLKSINNICVKYKDLLKETFETGLLRSEDLEATKKLIYNN
jgi:hypothetical protein